MSARRAVLLPADVRFPLERASGVQIVKTAAARARAGTPTTLGVRQSCGGAWNKSGCWGCR